MFEQLANNYFLIFVLIFFILILAGFLAFYLHVAGFTLIEVILLVAFPLLAFFSALPLVGGDINIFTGGISGTVFATAKVFDVPIVHIGHAVIGVNAVGFFIPTLITLNILMYKRIPQKKFYLLAVIIAAVTFDRLRQQRQVG